VDLLQQLASDSSPINLSRGQTKKHLTVDGLAARLLGLAGRRILGPNYCLDIAQSTCQPEAELDWLL
jgi:hypothetical protein